MIEILRRKTMFTKLVYGGLPTPVLLITAAIVQLFAVAAFV